MNSNVVQFPQPSLSLDMLASNFVSRFVETTPSPFGRYGGFLMNDGVHVLRVREPPGADAAYRYVLKWEGRELFIGGGRAMAFRENERFWREWLIRRLEEAS